MQYSIEFGFDSLSSTQIVQLWKKVSRAGFFNPTYEANGTPHISLAIYDHIKLDKYVNIIGVFSREIQNIKISFSDIEVFRGEESAVYLSLSPQSELFDLQKKLVDLLSEYSDQLSENYKLEKWIPHCSVAKELSNNSVGQVTSLCRSFNFPLEATINTISLVEFRPRKVLHSMPLK